MKNGPSKQSNQEKRDFPRQFQGCGNTKGLHGVAVCINNLRGEEGSTSNLTASGFMSIGRGILSGSEQMYGLPQTRV